MPRFLPNAILHIEDDKDFRSKLADFIQRSEPIEQAFGNKIQWVNSCVLRQLNEGDLEAELNELYRPSEKQDPLLVSVASAQVARGYLNRYIPAVVISDTSFPLNGQKVAEWLQSHGFPDYALIGLSGTPIDELPPILKNWFATGNSRYLEKGDHKPMELEQQIVRNRLDNIRKYGQPNV